MECGKGCIKPETSFCNAQRQDAILGCCIQLIRAWKQGQHAGANMCMCVSVRVQYMRKLHVHKRVHIYSRVCCVCVCVCVCVCARACVFVQKHIISSPCVLSLAPIHQSAHRGVHLAVK